MPRKSVLTRALVSFLCLVLVISIPRAWAEETDPSLVSAITLNCTETEVIKGRPLALKAVVEPQTAKNKRLAWSSTDEDIAVVVNGNVQGKSNGRCDIICRSTDGSEIEAVCHVEVRTSVKSLIIQEKNVTVLIGSTAEAAVARLSYTVLPEDASWRKGIWSSANEQIAVVDENGKVTGLAAGKTVITLKTDEPNSAVKAVAQITVNQAVTGIEADQEAVSVPVNRTAQIKARVTPADAANKMIRWSSEDESVAAVTNGGVITGKAVGTTRIIAEAADGSGARRGIEVTVVQPVRKIDTDQAIVLPPSMTRKIRYNVLPEEATDKTIAWSSNKEAVATVSEDGVIESHETGTCTVIGQATDGSGVRVQIKVTVKKFDVVITGRESVNVNFSTQDGWSGSRIQIGSRVYGDYEETKVKFKNGCVESAGRQSLRPVKPGEDTITVTVKHNGKKVRSKKTYTVYVAPEAFEEDDETGTDRF